MRVKIGDTWYDANTMPILVEFTGKDKENIAKMDPKATKYYVYPDTVKPKEIRAWMKK